MGLGDDLLFLGEAEKLHKKTGKKIQPLYGSGESPLFENVEFLISHKTANSITLNARDYEGISDYHVDYYTREKKNTPQGQQLIYQHYKPIPFHLRFTIEEIKKASEILYECQMPNEFVVVNPDYKSKFYNNNKNWGFDKWQQLTHLLGQDIQVVRFMPGGEYSEPSLEGAINIIVPDVRINMTLCMVATLGVSFDGLLVHVLAGFDIPCVNIMGGLLHPDIMSYPKNINLYYDHPETPCGRTFNCSHCVEANQAITVEEVYQACKSLL